MKRRRWKRRKQLLDDLKEDRRYRKLKEDTRHRNLWRTGFDRGYGPVVRQLTLEWIYISIIYIFCIYIYIISFIH